MKAFRFRARALLDIRRRLRDEIQLALAHAQRAEQAAAAALDDAELRDRSAAVNGAVAVRAGGSVTEFERHRNWITHVRAEVDRLRQVRDERAAEVSTVRGRLRAAHQQVRVLERLRDQMWQRYQESVRRQEMRDMDEAAAVRFARQRSQGGE